MRKFLSITLSLSISAICLAQGEYNYVSLWKFKDRSHLITDTKGIENSTVEYITTNKKGKKTYHLQERFNEDGKLISTTNLNKKEPVLYNTNTYNKKGKLVNGKTFKRNGEIKREVKINYTTENKWKELKKFKNNKLKERKVWTHKVDGCLEKSTKENGKGKVKNTWLYEYYSECDKKRSVLLNANGKVKKEWTYDCKKEGEQLTKKEDVTQICKWEEVDKDHITKVYQSFDEKGRILKTVNKYRAIDTAIVSIKKFNGNDELISESTFKFDYKYPLAYAFYRNGKLKYSYDYKYIGNQKIAYNYYKYICNQKISYNYYRRGKRSFARKYTYNTKGLLTESIFLNKNDEKISATAYRYN